MVDESYSKEEGKIKSQLMKDLKDVCFPRLVGSEGDPKVRSIIKQKFKEIGYEPISEPVDTSFYRITHLQIFGNLAGGIFFLISAWLFGIHPLLLFIPMVLIFIEIAIMSSGSPAGGQPPKVPKFIKIYPSENIYAQNEHKTGNIQIIFMGHWDSKSTRLTAIQRAAAYIFFLLAALILIITGLIGMIAYFIPSIAYVYDKTLQIIWVTAIIGFVISIIICFNTVGNKSPGASDNGTSIGNVLQCARYFKEHPINNVNFTFLLTTAEETGLTGAFNFIKNRKDKPEWPIEKTFCINWDVAGTGDPVVVNDAIGIPKKQCSKKMSCFLDQIAEEQKIPIKKLYLPIGGWTDSLCFNYFGYESFTIGGFGGTSKVHSTRDTIDIIKEESYFHSWIVGVELAIKLAKSF